MRKATVGFRSLFVVFAPGILTAALAIVDGQVDSFEDGTTQEWDSGSNNFNPPQNVADGGPTGAGDNYLQALSTGIAGDGGKLVIFNTDQWTGDYTTAGVTVISMHLNNFGPADLQMRLAFDGAGGRFSSTNAVELPAGSGWQAVSFPIEAGDLTAVEGGTDVSATLSSVTVLRLLHATAPRFSGGGSPTVDLVSATLGVDNITAGPVPLPVELASFDALVEGTGVFLKWETVSETNNAGFEVQMRNVAGPQRAVSLQEEWHPLALVEGTGTTSEPQAYSYRVEDLAPGRYRFRLKQIDFDGAFVYSAAVEVTIDLPEQYLLTAPYPNPFNPQTQFSLMVSRRQQVEVAVYDALGRRVRVLYRGVLEAGLGRAFVVEGSGLSSGLYVIRAEGETFAAQRRMVLFR